jgi:hypothetical protein
VEGIRKEPLVVDVIRELEIDRGIVVLQEEKGADKRQAEFDALLDVKRTTATPDMFWRRDSRRAAEDNAGLDIY